MIPLECTKGLQILMKIETPEELLEAAEWMFSEDNPERVDVPKLSFTTDIAWTDKIKLGDTVTVYDRDFDTVSAQRVVGITYYPYDQEQAMKITVGTPKTSVSDLFGGMVQESIRYQIKTNDRGELKTPWLEGLKENYRTEFNTNLADNEKEGRQTMVHDYGDIWVNPNNPEQAMGIAGGVFALANSRLPNGDYNWTAFGDWTGFTADRINAGTIYTNDVTIKGFKWQPCN